MVGRHEYSALLLRFVCQSRGKTQAQAAIKQAGDTPFGRRCQVAGLHHRTHIGVHRPARACKGGHCPVPWQERIRQTADVKGERRPQGNG